MSVERSAFCAKVSGGSGSLGAGALPASGKTTPAVLERRGRRVTWRGDKWKLGLRRDWRGTGRGGPGVHAERLRGKGTTSPCSHPKGPFGHSFTLSSAPSVPGPGLGTEVTWLKGTQVRGR